VSGESLPGEEAARIDFARRGDVAVRQIIARWNPVARAQSVEQGQQGDDLRFGKGFVAGVVEFNADRRRVEVGGPAPPRFAGMPGAGRLIDELHDGTVTPDQIVGADLALRVGQGCQGCRRVVVAGLVQDDEIGAALVEAGGGLPLHAVSLTRRQRRTGRKRCEQEDSESAPHDRLPSDGGDRLGESCPALRLGLVHFGHLAAVGLARSLPLTRGLDAADAAPALAGLGFDLAHLCFRMMLPAVVTEGGFGHADGLGQLDMPIVDGLAIMIL